MTGSHLSLMAKMLIRITPVTNSGRPINEERTDGGFPAGGQIGDRVVAGVDKGQVVLDLLGRHDVGDVGGKVGVPARWSADSRFSACRRPGLRPPAVRGAVLPSAPAPRTGAKRLNAIMMNR